MTTNRQTFTLTFGEEFQPYSGSKSLGVILKTKPKKEYGIKKVKGFNRVINIGWSYIVERI